MLSQMVNFLALGRRSATADESVYGIVYVSVLSKLDSRNSRERKRE
jgi:hypothetical protein